MKYCNCNTSYKQHREKGNQAYAFGGYKDALNEYTIALEQLQLLKPASFVRKKNGVEESISKSSSGANSNEASNTMNPTDYAAIYAAILSNRSAVHLKLGSYKCAKEDALSSLQHDECSVKAHYRCGLALVGLQEYEDAKIYFEQGLSIAEGNTKDSNGRTITKQ